MVQSCSRAEVSPAQATNRFKLLSQVYMGKKATQILTTASSTPTLFCLKDKLLSGGADDLISTFQPNAVEPSNGILNSWVSSSEKGERKKKTRKEKCSAFQLLDFCKQGCLFIASLMISGLQGILPEQQFLISSTYELHLPHQNYSWR